MEFLTPVRSLILPKVRSLILPKKPFHHTMSPGFFTAQDDLYSVNGPTPFSCLFDQVQQRFIHR